MFWLATVIKFYLLMDNDISGAKPEVLRAQSVKRLNKHIIAWVVFFLYFTCRIEMEMIDFNHQLSPLRLRETLHLLFSFILTWPNRLFFQTLHVTTRNENQKKISVRISWGFFSYFAWSYSIFIEIWQMNTMFIKGSLYGEKFLLIVTVVIQYPN